jgi:HK97 family phage portal protein
MNPWYTQVDCSAERSWDVLGGIVAGGAENPRNPIECDENDETFMPISGGSVAGPRVTERSVLGLHALYRGINLLANDVGKLPLITYRYVKIGKSEGKEPDLKHAAYQLLKWKPNSFQNRFTFFRLLMQKKIIRGNFYALIVRNLLGEPEEILPLDSEETCPIKVAGELRYTTWIDEQLYVFPKEDVIHQYGLGFDGWRGRPLLEVAKESLGGAIAVQDYGNRYFQNNAVPGLVIETPGSLSDVAYDRMKKAWGRSAAGLKNQHRTRILEQGAKATKLQPDAQGAQLLETSQAKIIEMANWIGVPAHKIGHMGRQGYASLEQENQSYLDDGLDPHLVSLELELWDKLLTEQQKAEETHSIEFTRQALVRTNLAVRSAFYRTALGGAPFMSRNEVRALENRNPIEGLDEILEPKNMGQGGADNAPADPAAPEPGGQEGAETSGVPDLEAEGERMRPLVRSLVEATAKRLLRRLSTHGQRHDRKQTLRTWLGEQLVAEHRAVLVDAFAELAAAADQVAPGRSVSAEALADDLLGRFRRFSYPSTDTQTTEAAAAIAAWAVPFPEK